MGSKLEKIDVFHHFEFIEYSKYSKISTYHEPISMKVFATDIFIEQKMLYRMTPLLSQSDNFCKVKLKVIILAQELDLESNV